MCTIFLSCNEPQSQVSDASRLKKGWHYMYEDCLEKDHRTITTSFSSAAFPHQFHQCLFLVGCADDHPRPLYSGLVPSICVCCINLIVRTLSPSFPFMACKRYTLFTCAWKSHCAVLLLGSNHLKILCITKARQTRRAEEHCTEGYITRCRRSLAFGTRPSWTSSSQRRSRLSSW